jgi:hypothetical protein
MSRLSLWARLRQCRLYRFQDFLLFLWRVDVTVTVLKTRICQKCVQFTFFECTSLPLTVTSNQPLFVGVASSFCATEQFDYGGTKKNTYKLALATELLIDRLTNLVRLSRVTSPTTAETQFASSSAAHTSTYQ